MSDAKNGSKEEIGKVPTVRYIDSDALFQGSKTVVIRHSGEEYRLMVTKNDRLILHK